MSIDIAQKASLQVDLAPNNPRELVLRNPVIPASGCFGYGQEYSHVIDIQRLGAFSSKGITMKPRKGNPMPRITETPAGMLNAIGLQNPGIDKFIKKYPPIWEKWDVPAIVNFSADTVEDFAIMARKLDDVPGVAGLEVNISCPNIHAGGFCFGWDARMSADVAKAVREATTLPVIVKLSPGAVDIAEIAAAVAEQGVDAISLINTLVGMSIDPITRTSKIANMTGGLSGPAVKPVAVRQTYQVAQAVDIPIVGIGGIMGLSDALEFFMAGATAVQMGTAVFSHPSAPIKLIDDLQHWLDAQGCASVMDIVGVANPRFRATGA